MKLKKTTKYWLVSIGSVILTALIGSLATFNAVDGWYQTIAKPGFSPPNWIFGPVWTILYFILIIVLFLILNSNPTKHRQKVLNIFYLQLFFNALWSILFFGLNLIGSALFVIAILWFLIFLCITNANKFSLNAGWLMIPYLLWVSFASILNYSIWLLN
ncbi:TspO protein [Candidatus Berkelbacteria bacterium CG_4_8_14_3_um_filter_33_6]|uniref:TspO protein n=1 Tax=Candidatus Berkelbacteria bacterium CG_4_10_14_0_2_um_filter_35_9_33_12 TaxID=1974499 RepID=A0A2M7W4S4_9BACT|nr:MAG: TspO protein [Candidatus Berkelbacteria bacterium CG23_combo_of_CG06-09_8_20_14_all_33_15]PIX31380.1 MAG: TspO protein [Candidatus Berkelbacteria bacterium CG_4_8_14_3_um_filter_33_6]PIZ28526.1 MAG: TspO protein [Candidatus Berkelbacteria bacterium CG_4_10_14_0_8_um_filter_35_9_33_8]PJA20884.1 MAG: TspO protein [Candidatus Berkelbacteria bacterium CG_4_10_14_0_2_um_filter_35_9_33_12]PJB52019.1 MAG: TspO protein [Candidatus Berkelbacteria bacterium CG_4_9_14_3_um_filter_33_5]